MSNHPEFDDYSRAAPELVAAAAIEPQPFTIRFIGRLDGKPHEHEGFLVPETNDTLAVDERYPADDEGPASWWITHIPTTHHVAKYPYTVAETREQAIAIAQRFYREVTALGADMKSSDSAAIVNVVNGRGEKERLAFWIRVGGGVRS